MYSVCTVRSQDPIKEWSPGLSEFWFFLLISGLDLIVVAAVVTSGGAMYDILVTLVFWGACNIGGGWFLRWMGISPFEYFKKKHRNRQLAKTPAGKRFDSLVRACRRIRRLYCGEKISLEEAICLIDQAQPTLRALWLEAHRQAGLLSYQEQLADHLSGDLHSIVEASKGYLKALDEVRVELNESN